MRGLGRAAVARKGRILGVTLICAVVAFVVVNLITPRYPLRSAAAAGIARERVPARRGRQEQRPQRHRSRGGDQPDPARAVARSRARRDHQGEARRQARVRPGAAASVCARFSACSARPRSRHDDAAKSARWKPITSGSTSMRSKSRASSPIDFTSADPDLAASVANTIAETYLQMQQAAKQEQTRAAGVWLAGEIDKMRDEGRRRRSQGRGLSRQVQSVRRLQQFVAVEPAAYRDQFADLRGARPEGRPARRARMQLRDAHQVGQADRLLRHRQFANRCAA